MSEIRRDDPRLDAAAQRMDTARKAAAKAVELLERDHPGQGFATNIDIETLARGLLERNDKHIFDPEGYRADQEAKLMASALTEKSRADLEALLEKYGGGLRIDAGATADEEKAVMRELLKRCDAPEESIARAGAESNAYCFGVVKARVDDFFVAQGKERADSDEARIDAELKTRKDAAHEAMIRRNARGWTERIEETADGVRTIYDYGDESPPEKNPDPKKAREAMLARYAKGES